MKRGSTTSGLFSGLQEDLRGRVTVATLNYDLCTETLGERFRVPVDLGIDEWLRTGKCEWMSNGIQLLKLHGD